MCSPPSYRKGSPREGSVCDPPSYRKGGPREGSFCGPPSYRKVLGRDLCAVLRPTGRAALGRDLSMVLRPTGESSGGILLPFSALREGHSFLSHSLCPFLRQPHHKEVVGDSEKHVMLVSERPGAEARSPAKARCSSPSRGSGARTGILAERDCFSPIPLPSPQYSSSCPPPSTCPENQFMIPTLPWPSCLHPHLPVASCCSCRHQLASPLRSAGRDLGPRAAPPLLGRFHLYFLRVLLVGSLQLSPRHKNSMWPLPPGEGVLRASVSSFDSVERLTQYIQWIHPR